MPRELRDVPGYEGRYAVTREGRLWSHPGFKKPGGWIVGKVSKDGYRYVCVRKDGQAQTLRVSAVVLETFVCPRPEGHEADHINNVRNDDRLVNLRWLTRKENVGRIWSQGRRTMRGTNNSHSFLSEQDVLQIRRTYARGGVSYKNLALQLGLKKSHVADICSRRTWSHI